MRIADVQLYLSDAANVEGWLFPVHAFLFALIDAIQDENHIAGNLFEIGVHLPHMRAGDKVTIATLGLHDGQTVAHMTRVITLGPQNEPLSIAEA